MIYVTFFIRVFMYIFIQSFIELFFSMLKINFLFRIYIFIFIRLSCTDSKRRQVKKGFVSLNFFNFIFLFYSFIIYLYAYLLNDLKLFLTTLQSHELIHSCRTDFFVHSQLCLLHCFLYELLSYIVLYVTNPEVKAEQTHKRSLCLS